jgi:hypothetical protein
MAIYAKFCILFDFESMMAQSFGLTSVRHFVVEIFLTIAMNCSGASNAKARSILFLAGGKTADGYGIFAIMCCCSFAG